MDKNRKEELYLLVMSILEDLEKCPNTYNNSAAIQKVEKLYIIFIHPTLLLNQPACDNPQ